MDERYRPPVGPRWGMSRAELLETIGAWLRWVVRLVKRDVRATLRDPLLAGLLMGAVAATLERWRRDVTDRTPQPKRHRIPGHHKAHRKRNGDRRR